MSQFPQRSRTERATGAPNLSDLFSADRFGANRSFGLFNVLPPEDWSVGRSSPWTYVTPQDSHLPQQGWKIHVSTTETIAAQVLTLTAQVCFQRTAFFKHLTSVGELRASNSKYSSRGSAGKFVTIYPAGTEEFEDLLTRLDVRLAGLPGPYILSDAKYGSGPVFFRYGGFREMRSVSPDGDEILCIRDELGELVEDKRGPQYEVPGGVHVPRFVAHTSAERINPTDDDLADLLGDLVFQEALHFSNGGGVYRLRDSSSGASYVMKEGRQHAGWDPSGSDAYSRTIAEYATLRALEVAAATPTPSALKIVEGHAFLIEEYVEGRNLHSWMASEFPFSYAYSVHDYEARALAVIAHISAAVARIHALGYAVMDLQPFNIIVATNGAVRLIDLESCRPLQTPDASTAVGTPGYLPKSTHSAVERDQYALLQIALGLFHPMVSVASVSDAVIPDAIERLSESFSGEVVQVIEDLARPVRPLLRPDLPVVAPLSASSGQAIDYLVSGLVRGIRRARDHKRSALRPYPLTDVMPGSMAELSIEAGLSGIMAALGDDDENAESDVAFLAERARNCPVVAPGLLSGALGACLVLAARGEQETARDLYLRRVTGSQSSANISLRNGQAGEVLGTHLLAAKLGDAQLRQRGDEALEILLRLVDEGPSELNRAGGATAKALGLIHGWSGASLALSAVAGILDRPELYSYARRALDLDMQSMLIAPDGSLQADDGYRMMPYIADGSAGFGLAISALPVDFRRSKDDETLHRVAAACRVRACVSGGLFHGRAGLLLAMKTVLMASSNTDAAETLLDEQLPLLRSYLFSDSSGKSLFIASNDNRRLSLDLAQGAAGAVAALRALKPTQATTTIALVADWLGLSPGDSGLTHRVGEVLV